MMEESFRILHLPYLHDRTFRRYHWIRVSTIRRFVEVPLECFLQNMTVRIMSASGHRFNQEEKIT